MEENQNASGSQEPVSDNSSGDDKVAYETYKKVLGEKKKMQSEFLSMQEKLKAIELEKQQAEGNKDDVINSLRTQLNEEKSQKQEIKKNFVWNTIQGQIKNEAISQGCVNPDKLIKLMSKDDLASVEIDDSFNVNKEDLTRLMDDAKKQHADIGLFKAKRSEVHDVTNHNIPKTPVKSKEQLSKDEIKQQLRNME